MELLAVVLLRSIWVPFGACAFVAKQGCGNGYCGSSKFCPRRCRNTMLLQLLLREQLRCTIALVATQGYCNYRNWIFAIELAPLS
jgi:hypothetical protein